VTEFRFVTLVLALAAGIAVGFAADMLGGKTHRAQAVLQASAAPGPPGDPAPATAQVLAEGYAHLVGQRSFLERIQGQVAGGRLTAEELGRRLRAERPEGTTLVEVVAEGPDEAEARGLATDVSAALVALAQELARQQAAQAEDALRQRLAEVDAELADAGDEQQLRALEEERAALVAQLAEVPARSAERGAGLVVAAPAAVDPAAASPSLVQNLVAGSALGLVVWVGLLALRRDRGRPVREGELVPRAEPAPAAAPGPAPAAAPPAVAIAEPRAGASVSGRVRLRAEAERAASVSLLLSDGGADWKTLGEGPELDWSTSGLPAGAYWLCAVATGPSGEQAASELVPVMVR
jgi:hypothetical protein